jgi:hypothetical protein
MSKKIGLVAFFDILGYQNFLENNEPEIAAEKISEFLKSLSRFKGEQFLEIVRKTISDRNEVVDYIKTINEKINYLSISDAILLTLEADKNEGKQIYLFNSAIFLAYCTILHKELFVYGLPTRGAIEYGEYILIDNQMFAGRPIVNAYRTAMELNLSACLVSKSVNLQSPEWDKFKNILFVEYITPLVTGEEKELALLFPLPGLGVDNQHSLSQPDIKQFIIKSFSAHNKMINKKVQNKISNTEYFFRYCRTIMDS